MHTAILSRLLALRDRRLHVEVVNCLRHDMMMLNTRLDDWRRRWCLRTALCVKVCRAKNSFIRVWRVEFSFVVLGSLWTVLK